MVVVFPVLFLISYLVDIVTIVFHYKGIMPQFVNVMLNVNLAILLLLLGYVATAECSSDAKAGIIAILVIGSLFAIFFPFKLAMLFTSVFIGTIVLLFILILSMFMTGHN